MAYQAQKDLFPFVGTDEDTDILLFFTDNKNEPKKINVRRCIEDDELFSGNAPGYSGENLRDFIVACPKTPVQGVRFTWTKNVDFESNFRGKDGFQFAYQNVYIDGFISSISPISDISFPPAIQNLGANSLSNVTVESECILEIPSQTQEITAVRILFREGNTGPFKLIDTVSNLQDFSNPSFEFIGTEVLGYYKFRNDSIYPIVPSSQTEKNYDNLPRRAKAQSVSGNRLMYGNYVDGYDPVQTSAKGEPVFQNVDQNLNAIAGEIKALNLFTLVMRDSSAEADYGYAGGRGESIGFSIDVGTDNIEPGVYRVSLDFSPEMSYHIFDGSSYFPSKNQTFNGDSDYQFENYQLGPATPASNAAVAGHKIYASEAGQPVDADGNKLLQGLYAEKTSIANAGMTIVKPGTGDSSQSFVVGSTAANPIIIPKAPIFVDIVLEVIQTVTADTFMTDLVSIIDNGTAISEYVTPLSYSGDDLELGPANNPYFFSVNEDVSGVTAVVESRLNLESGATFAANSSIADNISYIPSGTFFEDLGLANSVPNAPMHFYIVNKADMLLNLRSIPIYNNDSTSPYHGIDQDNPQTSTKRYFRFEVCEVRNHELLSCLPEPVEGLGYAPFSGASFDGPSLMPWFSGSVLAGEVNSSQLRWPCVGHYGIGTDYPAVSQNFPKGIAVFDRDGNDMTFENLRGGPTNDTYRVHEPIAIGRWRAYSSNQMFDKEWISDFEYTFFNPVGGFSGTTTVRPTDTNTWLSPMSRMWEAYINYDAPAPDAQPLILTNPHSSKFLSIIDGKAGMGGRTEDGVDGFSSVADDEVFFAIAEGDERQIEGTVGNWSESQNSGPAKPVSNRRGSIWNSTLLGIHDNFKYIRVDAIADSDDSEAYKTPDAPLDSDIFAAPLENLGSFIDVGVEGNSISSFKTKDFHDFGVVYFDDRGRAGGVNILPSVYVPGYSNSERAEDEKGAVYIKYTLEHVPPEWATDYKIVYAGSATTERFIQYSSGGAFTEPNIIGGDGDKIYVSLNYLQRNRASYSKSYGAIDQDTGEQTLYRFTPGDKLRVISYYSDDDTIVYVPKGYEFDIVGIEEISEEQESPLISETAGTTNYLSNVDKFGSFVVLRNNLGANGFTASEVSSNLDKWGDRCIFEIVTPRKERGEELKPYYETQVGGRIIVQNGQRVHEFGTMTITQGDVYFRRVPVNFRPYNNATSSFDDLIGGDGANETSQARFKPYFLESNSVTDLFRSNSKSYGKPHFYVDGYAERLNDSSITYSAPTNQESYNLFYTSFSPLVKNYFDMPSKYGDIDYLADAGDNIYVAQNSKIGKLQVDKSLTTTASGVDTLNLSSDVLSSPRFFLESVGTDGNPESVTWVNNTLYFVDKSRGVVASAGERGMSFISSQGMDKFFKRFFKKHDTDPVRITTGYNPFYEEIVVSMVKSDSVNELVNSTPNLMSNPDYGYTFAYDLAAKAWTSSYTFHSSNYQNVGNSFLSFKDVDGRSEKKIAWTHNGEKNNFYGRSYMSSFEGVINEGPNLTKDFKSISVDGTSPWELSLSTPDQGNKIGSRLLRNYEGTFYYEIPRTESDGKRTGSNNSTRFKSLPPIRSVKTVARNEFILGFGEDISQYHITLSDVSFERSCEMKMFNPAISSSELIDFFDSNSNRVVIVPNEVVNRFQLRIKTVRDLSSDDAAMFPQFLKGKVPVVISSARVYGDSLRGKLLNVYAQASPRSVGMSDQELYSINVDYVESKLNSSR